jgi:hypothetical protein
MRPVTIVLPCIANMQVLDWDGGNEPELPPLTFF